MVLSEYGKLKYRIGYYLYQVTQEQTLDIADIVSLIQLYKDCGGTLNKIQQYLNILNMYSDEEARLILIQPNLLITIDNIDKEMAYIIRFSK